MEPEESFIDLQDKEQQPYSPDYGKRVKIRNKKKPKFVLSDQSNTYQNKSSTNMSQRELNQLKKDNPEEFKWISLLSRMGPHMRAKFASRCQKLVAAANTQEQTGQNLAAVTPQPAAKTGQSTGNSSTNPGAAAVANPGAIATNGGADDKDMEIQQLKMLLEMQKKRAATGGKGNNNKKKNKPGSENAMYWEVRKTATTALWQVCKFIKDEEALALAMEYVMSKMDIKTFQGLKGEALTAAQELFMAEWSDLVRTAINEQRNYVQHEIRDHILNHVFKARDGNPDDWPNKEQMKEVIMRRGMGDDDPTRAEYDGYLLKVWDELLPKVCGECYWNPNKRYYGNISTHVPDPTEEDPDPDPYVHHSNEAFLLWLWENVYDKWWYLFDQNEPGTSPEFKQKIKQLKRKDEAELTADEKALLKAMDTPYTNCSAGQHKFGGWHPESLKVFNKYKKEIKKNRVDRAEEIKVIEDRVLEAVRTQQQRAEIDARRVAGGRGGRRAGNSDGEGEEDESDDDDLF